MRRKKRACWAWIEVAGHLGGGGVSDGEAPPTSSGWSSGGEDGRYGPGHGRLWSDEQGSLHERRGNGGSSCSSSQCLCSALFVWIRKDPQPQDKSAPSECSLYWAEAQPISTRRKAKAYYEIKPYGPNNPNTNHFASPASPPQGLIWAAKLHRRRLRWRCSPGCCRGCAPPPRAPSAR